MKGWRIAAMVLGLVAFWPAPASAQSGDEAKRAKKLFEDGVELARQKKWSAALEALEASRALVERPRTLFNIGTVLLRLSRPTEALAAFESFLALSSAEDDAGRAAARKLMDEAAKMQAPLELEVSPETADVTLDGRRDEGRGSTRRLALDPGEHELVVSAPEHETTKRNFSASPGRALELRITLERTLALAKIEPAPIPEPPADTPTGARAEPDLDLDPLPPSTSPVVGVTGVPKDSIAASPWLWLGVTGAMLVLGVVIAVATVTGPEAPYRGTLGVELHGLEDR